MQCEKCGGQMSDNANFCPTCGAPAPKKERKNTEEKKNYARGARFHVRISEARINGLHWKLAELAAVITCVIMGIWSYVTIGRPQVGALILLFIIYSIVFQIISRFIFFLMDVFSRRAYNAYVRSGQGGSSAGTEEGRRGRGSARRAYGSGYDHSSTYGENEAGSGSYNSSYGRSAYRESSESDLAYEKAKEMFHLKDNYTMKDLNKRRNDMLIHGKMHPDDGGDPEKFKEMMAAYERLKLYASK